MLLQGYKLKTCYNSIKSTPHYCSTEVEGIAPLCPGDQLPPPCGLHQVILTVALMLCLLYLLLVVINVDKVTLPGFYSGLETKVDTPHTSHGNCEHSCFKHLFRWKLCNILKQATLPDCVSSPTPGMTMFVEECRSLLYGIVAEDVDHPCVYPHQIPFWSSDFIFWCSFSNFCCCISIFFCFISIFCCQEST